MINRRQEDIIQRLEDFANWLVSAACGNVPDEATLADEAAKEIKELVREVFIWQERALAAEERVETLVTTYGGGQGGETGSPPLHYLPADIIESLLAIGPVEWGQTHTQTDGKHIDDLEDTLKLTREHFGIEDKETAIHGVYLAGSGVVLAHTGMSPNSPQHARILAGAWNQLVDIAKAEGGAA